VTEPIEEVEQTVDEARDAAVQAARDDIIKGIRAVVATGASNLGWAILAHLNEVEAGVKDPRVLGRRVDGITEPEAEKRRRAARVAAAPPPAPEPETEESEPEPPPAFPEEVDPGPPYEAGTEEIPEPLLDGDGDGEGEPARD